MKRYVSSLLSSLLLVICGVSYCMPDNVTVSQNFIKSRTNYGTTNTEVVKSEVRRDKDNSSSVETNSMESVFPSFQKNMKEGKSQELVASTMGEACNVIMVKQKRMNENIEGSTQKEGDGASSIPVNDDKSSMLNWVLFLLMMVTMLGIGVFLWLFAKKSLAVEVENIETAKSQLLGEFERTNNLIDDLKKGEESNKQDMLRQVVSINQIVTQNAETSKKGLENLRDTLLNSHLVGVQSAITPKMSQSDGSVREYKDQITALNTKLDGVERQLKDTEQKVLNLTRKNSDLIQQNEELRCRELESAVTRRDSIYGLEEKPEFQPFLNELQAWNNDAPREVAIIKSALVLGVMPPDKVDNDTFMGALKDISMSITSIMLSMKKSETEIRTELQKWATYLQRVFNNQQRQFSLVVPEVGSAVDVTWMRVGGNVANRVNGVRTWAVYGPFAVKYMAEIV